MTNAIPTRKEVSVDDTWDLSVLFSTRETWDKARSECIAMLPRIAEYEGSIKEDANYILSLYKLVDNLMQRLEFLVGYAHLEYSADSSSANSQELLGLATNLMSSVAQTTFFISEELAVLSTEFLESLRDSPVFADYRMNIVSVIRKKPHILSKAEEKLLSMQTSYSDGFNKAFNALNDIDMDFGSIELPEGPMPLTHANVSVCMEHEDRTVRFAAYEQFHTVFKKHINTLACLYAANIQQDNAHAKIRKYTSKLDKELYDDNIPISLYDNLIASTHKHLPVLHKYYELLSNRLQTQAGIEDYAVYDISAKPYPAPEHNMSYEEAVELVCNACAPLGEEYTSILRRGLLEERWVDRYENKGKRSGAFSMGVYGAYPYIMMNYQPKSLRHVFTLAHEAGHSMHSYFSSRAKPISQHNYTIFEAEVASTVNEFLLYRHLITTHESKEAQTYLLWHELQDFIGTFFRQTMFAEFELQSHIQDEKGQPLTVEFFTSLGMDLLTKYYGTAVQIPELSGVTCLRIPHFYRSYYVYKYATGIAAAVDIGSRIYNKEAGSLDGYFKFLESGSSRFPIDSLALAGIDYTTTTTIDNALQEFERKYKKLLALS